MEIRGHVESIPNILNLLRDDALVESARAACPLLAHAVAHHLQGGGGALELPLNNVASQGRGGISPGAFRQS